jgi:hypothetical protein
MRWRRTHRRSRQLPPSFRHGRRDMGSRTRQPVCLDRKVAGSGAADPFGTQSSPVNPPTRRHMPCPENVEETQLMKLGEHEVLNRVPVWSLRTRTRQHCTDLGSEKTARSADLKARAGRADLAFGAGCCRFEPCPPSEKSPASSSGILCGRCLGLEHSGSTGATGAEAVVDRTPRPAGAGGSGRACGTRCRRWRTRSRAARQRSNCDRPSTTLTAAVRRVAALPGLVAVWPFRAR